MARAPKTKAPATDARRVRKQKNGNVVEETRHARKLQARNKKRHDGELTRVRNGEEQVRLVTREPTATERHQAMGRAPRYGRTKKTHSEYKEAALAELKARTLECGEVKALTTTGAHSSLQAGIVAMRLGSCRTGFSLRLRFEVLRF
jgi:hypothetical protein